MVYGSAEEPATLSIIPCVQHLANAKWETTDRAENMTTYNYPEMVSAKFAMPGLQTFHYGTEAVTHTRNLTFLKRYIKGADFDLEAVWEEHTFFKFDERSPAKTMATMVQEPYVNHIPTVGHILSSPYSICSVH